MDTLVKQQNELSLKNACVEFMLAYQQRNVGKMLGFAIPTAKYISNLSVRVEEEKSANWVKESGAA